MDWRTHNFSCILLIGISKSYLNKLDSWTPSGEGIIMVFQLLYWIFFESSPIHHHLDCQWEAASIHTASVCPVQGRYSSPAPTQKQDLSGSLIAPSNFLIPFGPRVSQRAEDELTVLWTQCCFQSNCFLCWKVHLHCGFLYISLYLCFS